MVSLREDVELEGVDFALGRDFTTGIFLESLHRDYRRRIATIHPPSSSPNPPFHPSEEFIRFVYIFEYDLIITQVLQEVGGYKARRKEKRKFRTYEEPYTPEKKQSIHKSEGET